MLNEVQAILQSHKILKEVRYATPSDWLNWDSIPQTPVACYSIDTGQYMDSYQRSFTINFWFLDKSGVDAEFDKDVTSDMHQIGSDIVNAMYLKSKPYSIDMPILWTAISEKYEDYLSGVMFSINVTTNGDYSYCDFPL
jgi:hypothetical protein